MFNHEATEYQPTDAERQEAAGREVWATQRGSTVYTISEMPGTTLPYRVRRSAGIVTDEKAAFPTMDAAIAAIDELEEFISRRGR